MTTFKSWLAEDGYQKDGYWAGVGGGASGILPISKTSKRICLGWRSAATHMGDCWGVFGGAIMEGHSPEDSAIVELHQETGYHDKVALHKAYIFRDGSFKYYNFVGVVEYDFQFNPDEQHSWELDEIQWFTYPEVLKEIQNHPRKFHPGVITLFKQSKSLIEEVLQQLTHE